MGRKTVRAALPLCLLGLVYGRQAIAQVEEVQEAAPPPETKAAEIPIDDHTAYIVPRHRVRLGLLAFDYGLTDRVAVGVDPLIYLARTVSDVFVPNAHVKFVMYRNQRFTLSGELAGYYGFLDSETSGRDEQFLLLPATLYGSGQLSERFWLHGEVNYNHVRARTNQLGGRADLDGAVVNRNWQFGAMLEYRLSRVVGFLARGRLMAFSSPLVITGEGMLDPYTTAELGANYRPNELRPWVALGAAAFTWKHVGFIVGGGYGQYFVPGGNVPVPYRGFTPEGSLWVQF